MMYVSLDGEILWPINFGQENFKIVPSRGGKITAKNAKKNAKCAEKTLRPLRRTLRSLRLNPIESLRKQNLEYGLRFKSSIDPETSLPAVGRFRMTYLG